MKSAHRGSARAPPNELTWCLQLRGGGQKNRSCLPLRSVPSKEAMTLGCVHTVPGKKNRPSVNDNRVKPYRSPEGRPRGSSDVGVCHFLPPPPPWPGPGRSTPPRLEAGRPSRVLWDFFQALKTECKEIGGGGKSSKPGGLNPQSGSQPSTHVLSDPEQAVEPWREPRFPVNERLPPWLTGL